jgi:hypothetical protein
MTPAQRRIAAARVAERERMRLDALLEAAQSAPRSPESPAPPPVDQDARAGVEFAVVAGAEPEAGVEFAVVAGAEPEAGVEFAVRTYDVAASVQRWQQARAASLTVSCPRCVLGTGHGGTVYTISDPCKGEIYYVGSTTHLISRADWHLTAPHNEELRQIMARIYRHGCFPRWRVLQCGIALGELADVEAGHIYDAILAGEPLTNACRVARAARLARDLHVA